MPHQVVFRSEQHRIKQENMKLHSLTGRVQWMHPFILFIPLFLLVTHAKESIEGMRKMTDTEVIKTNTIVRFVYTSEVSFSKEGVALWSTQDCFGSKTNAL